MKAHGAGSRFVPIVAFMLLAVMTALTAQAADPDKILIKNVHLIDREKVAEDVVVNILITDNKLEVVTKDDIDPETVNIVVDAQGGFLLGELEMGAPPSFVILDQDPRINFEVLLDTKNYAQFAVQNGVIVKNNLPAVAAAQPDPEEEPKRSGWLAYEPPPLALPLSYHDSRKWNKFETKYISGLFNGAIALDRHRWLSQDDASRGQVGDLAEFDGGEIRALRFGLAGTLNFKTPWVYVIAGATNGFDKGFDTTTTDDFTWFDYRVDVPVFKDTTLSIGKQKEPGRNAPRRRMPFSRAGTTVSSSMGWG